MSTYEFDKVLAEYANGRMTVEMAMGHSLQHIGKLYQAQTTVQTNQIELRTKTNVLEQKVITLQATVDRLAAWLEKVRRKPKKPNPPGQSPLD